MGLKYVGFLFPFPLSGCCDEFLLIDVIINEFEYLHGKMRLFIELWISWSNIVFDVPYFVTKDL